MPVDDNSAGLPQGTTGDLFLADTSARFVETVAEVYRLLGFEVRQAIRLRGVSLGLAVLYQRGGVRLPAVVLCQDTQVTEPACQHLLSQHAMVQRQLPDHQVIAVSSQGFTTESGLRLKATGLTCVTFGALLTSLAPLERYAAGLLNTYEAWVHQHGRDADHCIDPMVWDEDASAPTLALESLGRWLADTRASLFVLRGEPGAGKSTLLHMFAYHLARRFLDDPLRHPVPVLLSLADIRQVCPVASLLVNHFHHHGLSEVSIARLMYLVRLGKIVLLCDGFDAMAMQVPREVAQAHFQQLQRLATPPGKLLLACRPAALTHHYATPRALSGATVARLQLFDDRQLQAYLARVRPQTVTADWHTVQQLPDLKALAYQPALLDGLVAALDAQEYGAPLNPAYLYHVGINFWLEREARAAGHGLTGDALRAVLRALAWRLWQRDIVALPAREFEALAEQVLAVWLGDSATMAPARLVRELHLLAWLSPADEVASVAFRRDILLAYFLADNVLQSLSEDDSIPEGLQTRRLDRTVVTFLTVLDTADRLCAPLQRLLQRVYIPQVSENALQILYWSGRVRAGMAETLTEPEALRALLTERIPAVAQLRGARLHDMVLDAASLREADCTGADLTRAQLRYACLIGASLRQAVLVEAQFAEALADQADFSQADVTGAVFDGTQLHGSIFLGTNVHDAHFSETLTRRTATSVVSPAQAHRLQPVLQQGHAASIRTATYSLDGTFVASGDDEGLIWLYQASNGHILRGLEGHGGAIRGLACAPHAPLLASGSMDGSVRLWDVERGEAVWVLNGHSDGVLTVAFAPYGTLLASGSADHSLRLWDVTYGTLVQTLQGHGDAVQDVVFSSDGMHLISCSADHSLRVWDIAAGQAIKVYPVEPAWNQVLTVAPGATHLAYVGADGSIHLWDITRGALIRTLAAPQREVCALVFTPDGSRLAAGSIDGSVQIWEIGRSEPVRMFAAHQREVGAVAFAPDGAHLVSCSVNRGVRTWDMERGQPEWSRQGEQREVGAVAFTPTGNLLTAGSTEGSMHLWNLTQSAPVQVQQGQQRPSPALAFAPNGILLAQGGADRNIRLWDVTRGKLVRVLLGPHREAGVVAFAPTGALLAAGYLDGRLCLWDVVQGTPLWGLQGHQLSVAALAFASVSTLLASGSADRSIRLWETTRGEPIAILRGQQSAVTSLAFAPRGALLAAGSSRGSISLWDAAHHEPLQLLQEHQASVTALAFAPQGDLLASGGLDHRICLWDMTSGALVRVFQSRGGSVSTLAFAPNGKYLVAAGTAGGLQFWDVAQGTLFLCRYSFGPGVWLDVRPDGHFDASPAGRRFLGYTELGTMQAYRAEEVEHLFWDPQAIHIALAAYMEDESKEPYRT